MRSLLCVLAFALAPLVHAQPNADDRSGGWHPELGELELIIDYQRDDAQSQATPVKIALRSSARLVESLSTAAIEFNNRPGTRVRLARTERGGPLAASAGAPSPDVLKSIRLQLGDRSVLFPIPALETQEDGTQTGTYSDEDRGFWAVLVVGVPPPPIITIIIGDPPEDKEPEEPGETEPDETEEDPEETEEKEGEEGGGSM